MRPCLLIPSIRNLYSCTAVQFSTMNVQIFNQNYSYTSSLFLFHCFLFLATVFNKVFLSFYSIITEIREVKHHVYIKRQTRICTTWPSFPFACRRLFVISTHKLVVSRIILSVRIFWAVFICSMAILRKSQLESDVCRQTTTVENFLK